MSKQEPVTFEAEVLKELSNNRFRVDINGEEAIAYLSGQMREDDIRVVPGDTVDVEFSPYCLDTGRIVYRYEENNG